jgi:protein O-GlcNAc transferase
MPPVTIWQAFAFAQQHFHTGRFTEAERICRQILDQSPQNVDALNFLAVIAGQTNRHELAIALLRQCLAINPRSSIYHDNLGTALRSLGRFDEAIASGRQALALDPNEPITHENLANALQDKGLITESVASYQRALELAPTHIAGYTGLGRALVDLGRVREADTLFRRALQIDPTLSKAHSALLMNLHYLEDTSPETIFAEHRRWNQIHAQPLQKEIQPHLNDPSPDRRLRIGYVSPDFRNHPVAFFVEGLLAHHDPANVEVFCYANVLREDDFTARFRSYAHHWRDIASLTDEQAAALICEDRIDILVDLAGHTADHRLLIFARKPAPVQVTWLGYCDTTGLDAIDYFFTDAHVDPPGTGDRFYTEKLIRLPDTFACFRPLEDAPPINALPALQRGHVTFASFHNLAKLSHPLLESWAQILTRVPGAHLRFCAFALGETPAQDRLRTFFAERDIDATRLEFRPWQSLHDYLVSHHEVDILLDAHPFNGHTANCHALWMGIPPITLTGSRHCGRMVTSLLHNTGLPELIAQTLEQYIDIATKLACDVEELSTLRQTMRDRLSSSPLLDAPRFARAVEEAYREMWRRWCGSANTR